jgi:hypothetical protein
VEFEPPVSIAKKADDPTGIVRVEVAGDPEIGYYCVYRGSKEQAAELLLLAAKAMALFVKHFGTEEPQIEPDHLDAPS